MIWAQDQDQGPRTKDGPWTKNEVPGTTRSLRVLDQCEKRGKIPGSGLMPRPIRSVACLLIGVIAFAALVPGMSSVEWASFEPVWVLLPDETSVAVYRAILPGDEQPDPLFCLLPSRSPPSAPLA